MKVLYGWIQCSSQVDDDRGLSGRMMVLIGGLSYVCMSIEIWCCGSDDGYVGVNVLE